MIILLQLRRRSFFNATPYLLCSHWSAVIREGHARWKPDTQKCTHRHTHTGTQTPQLTKRTTALQETVNTTAREYKFYPRNFEVCLSGKKLCQRLRAFQGRRNGTKMFNPVGKHLNRSAISAGRRGAPSWSWKTAEGWPTGKRPASRQWTKERWSHPGLLEYSGDIAPRPSLPFPSYSINDLSSSPDSFSRGLSFLQTGFSLRVLPDLCAFHTAGICRSGCPERIHTKARERDRTSQPTFSFYTENP